nr:nucleotide-binding alpha-beta plait domain-containing protein [Tanacetum cinerariifolium]
MGRYTTKEDDVDRISTSVYVTNFPDSSSAKDLFQACIQYGHVVDSYIPSKKSKFGKRFGFVKFVNVFSKERLIKNLCTAWIGQFKLHANIARFQRSPGFSDIVIKYMGEFWVSLEFKSVESMSKFKECVSIMSRFDQVKDASMEFEVAGRIAWVEVEGWVPEFNDEVDDVEDKSMDEEVDNKKFGVIDENSEGERVSKSNFEDEELMKRQFEEKHLNKNMENSDDPFNIYHI